MLSLVINLGLSLTVGLSAIISLMRLPARYYVWGTAWGGRVFFLSLLHISATLLNLLAPYLYPPP